jgi:hypothetical protein
MFADAELVFTPVVRLLPPVLDAKPPDVNLTASGVACKCPESVEVAVWVWLTTTASALPPVAATA